MKHLFVGVVKCKGGGFIKPSCGEKLCTGRGAERGLGDPRRNCGEINVRFWGGGKSCGNKDVIRGRALWFSSRCP